MRAVVAASAWPSHLAMTASGTPRRCSAVPQEWRASCSRIGRTPAECLLSNPLHRQRSRLYPSTDSGIVAEMDARSEPGLNDPFEDAIDDALNSLPADLRAAMSNVAIVVEDGLPTGGRCSACTAVYRCREGAARTAECFPTRSASSAGQSRDLPAGDADRRTPRGQTRRAPRRSQHHFGIGDARLIDLDRY